MIHFATCKKKLNPVVAHQRVDLYTTWKIKLYNNADPVPFSFSDSLVSQNRMSKNAEFFDFYTDISSGLVEISFEEANLYVKKKLNQILYS